MPRCGTRQFADFLNRHPRLCLQGEIRGTLLGTIRGALEAAQQAYPRGYAARAFREKRARGVIDLFGLLSKGNRITKQGADIHGFKCPQMERQQGHITAIVRPAFKRLVWLHAIRNPVDCWLSLRAMPWFSDDPDQFVERYCSSLDYARNRRTKWGRTGRDGNRCAPVTTGAPAPTLAMGTTIAALDLDAFIASADKPGWLGQHLFAPLGLAPSAAELAHFAATTDNRNATTRATGAARSRMLDPADHARFEHHAPGSKRPSPPTTRGWARNWPCACPRSMRPGSKRNRPTRGTRHEPRFSPARFPPGAWAGVLLALLALLCAGDRPVRPRSILPPRAAMPPPAPAPEQLWPRWAPRSPARRWPRRARKPAC
jgi:hypothetical protein